MSEILLIGVSNNQFELWVATVGVGVDLILVHVYVDLSNRAHYLEYTQLKWKDKVLPFWQP